MVKTAVIVDRRRRALVALMLALAGGLPACSRREPTVAAAALPTGSVVLALGDSITHGTGAAPGESYPDELARLTGWAVVNAGVPGDTAAQVLARLPTLLQDHEPALVLLGAGGNDFLRRLPADETRDALEQAVDLCRAAGAAVLLIAVPRPSLGAAAGVSLSDHPLYAALAQSRGVALHADGWSAVLSDPALRDQDRIHANAAGYARFAQGLFERLQSLGWAASGS